MEAQLDKFSPLGGLNPIVAREAGWSEESVRLRWPFVYLATPYSHQNKEVQVFRFEAVTKAAGWLMNTYGWNVLSPITNSHPIHVLAPNVPGDWHFWQQVDSDYLRCSNRFVIFTLPGWRESVGVTAETDIAKGLGLPKQYLNIRDGQYFLEDEPGPDNILPFSIT